MFPLSSKNVYFRNVIFALIFTDVKTVLWKINIEEPRRKDGHDSWNQLITQQKNSFFFSYTQMM